MANDNSIGINANSAALVHHSMDACSVTLIVFVDVVVLLSVSAAATIRGGGGGEAGGGHGNELCCLSIRKDEELGEKNAFTRSAKLARMCGRAQYAMQCIVFFFLQKFDCWQSQRLWMRFLFVCLFHIALIRLFYHMRWVIWGVHLIYPALSAFQTDRISLVFTSLVANLFIRSVCSQLLLIPQIGRSVFVFHQRISLTIKY